MERGAEQTEQTERGAEQTERGAEQTEQGVEQMEPGAEQTERGAEQTERGAEQTERGAEHEVEHMERQPQFTERDMEQAEREESINVLERTVNLILSQKSDGSHVNDQTLAKALKELECSVVELIDDSESRTNNKGAIHQPANISFENVIASTPHSELQKDIRYSLEVWVSADKEKLFHNLNINERNILQSKKGWLNDVIIDSAMNLLQFQFPDLEGFQSCQYAVQLDFQRHDKLFIQIINRSPGAGGSHWLTVSNINCMEDEILCL